MPTPIRVLILEDRLADVELMLHELRRADFEPDWQCVETELDYLAQLREDIDVILSDYSMPQFDAPRALRLLRERGLDIPFIVVTGSISEEVAVECIKQGAADYLLKDRLARLGPAVTHAMQQKRLHLEKGRAEAALRERETLLRSLIENVSDIITILDDAGTIVFVSPSVERVLGYALEEFIGQNVFQFVHLDDHSKLGLFFKSTTKSRGIAQSGELRLRHQGGSWHIFEAIGNNLLDDPIIAGVVIDFRDITDRKRLEEQFLQAQKMEAVGRLAGGITHDFNNLLVVILGYSDFLLNSLGEDTPMYKDISQIKKAATRAASLTRQLLAFSRKQALQPKLLNLNTVVTDMGKMLRRLIGENIELVTLLGSALEMVKADPGQIGQVIINLVVNARDAMPQGGQITIETANVDLDENYARKHVAVRPGPYVMLAVSDTGIGMDENVRSHLFEPFFTTKDRGEGTGLGLSTVYGIVRQSGGHIWVYSEPDRGTTFKIYLPQAGETDDLRERVPPESTRGTETILLVEDEDMVRSLAHRIMVQHGYTVLEASRPDEALSVCERHGQTIHLLVTDVVMPGISGRDLAEKLSAIQPGIKILYMSGYTSNTIVSYGILDSGTAFLQKPFTPDALIQKVRQVLDAPP